MRVVTIDIETVHPSYTGDPDKFPPLPHHQPIVICWLLSDTKTKEFVMQCFYGSPGEAWEREALQSFRSDCLSAHRIVSFNGRGFDLPVLTLRAIAQRVEWVKMNDKLRERYLERGRLFHVDLCDLLTNYGAAKAFKLSDLAMELSLPGKALGLDGKQVEQAYADGKLEEIANYCVGDVVLTRLVYLRVAECLFGGWGKPETQEMFQETVRWTVEKCPLLADAYRYLLATP